MKSIKYKHLINCKNQVLQKIIIFIHSEVFPKEIRHSILRMRIRVPIKLIFKRTLHLNIIKYFKINRYNCTFHSTNVTQFNRV